MSLDDDFKLLKAKSREVCRLVGAHLTKQYGFEKMAVRWKVSSAVKSISPRRRFGVGVAHFGWVNDSALTPDMAYWVDDLAEVANFDVDKVLLPDPTERAIAGRGAYEMAGYARNHTLKFGLYSNADALAREICDVLDRTLPRFIDICADHTRLLHSLLDPEEGRRWHIGDSRMRSLFALLHEAGAPRSEFETVTRHFCDLWRAENNERQVARTEAYAKTFAERWLAGR